MRFPGAVILGRLKPDRVRTPSLGTRAAHERINVSPPTRPYVAPPCRRVASRPGRGPYGQSVRAPWDKQQAILCNRRDYEAK
jgi:hypothetical protein